MQILIASIKQNKVLDSTGMCHVLRQINLSHERIWSLTRLVKWNSLHGHFHGNLLKKYWRRYPILHIALYLEQLPLTCCLKYYFESIYCHLKSLNKIKWNGISWKKITTRVSIPSSSLSSIAVTAGTDRQSMAKRYVPVVPFWTPGKFRGGFHAAEEEVRDQWLGTNGGACAVRMSPASRIDSVWPLDGRWLRITGRSQSPLNR